MRNEKSKITSEEIKKIARDLGADLCGIASVVKFENAPEGFKPGDIYKKAKSVIVYAKRLPTEVLFAKSCIPYTHVNALITLAVDKLSLELSLKLQDLTIPNVMIPTDDPYEAWDNERRHGKAILSLRHAGYLAGLGKLGKNNLLINDKYGNMIQIGALLADYEFHYDEIAAYQACNDNCSACLKSCPQKALDGSTVNQDKCRKLSNFKTEKGYVLKKCWECRRSCPNATGIKIKTNGKD
jgi:epoxyqueuosine reductase